MCVCDSVSVSVWEQYLGFFWWNSQCVLCAPVCVLQHGVKKKVFKPKSSDQPLSHPETATPAVSISAKTPQKLQRFFVSSRPRLSSLRGSARCCRCLSTYTVTSLEFPFCWSSCHCINTTSSLLHSNTVATQREKHHHRASEDTDTASQPSVLAARFPPQTKQVVNSVRSQLSIAWWTTRLHQGTWRWVLRRGRWFW